MAAHPESGPRPASRAGVLALAAALVFTGMAVAAAAPAHSGAAPKPAATAARPHAAAPALALSPAQVRELAKTARGLEELGGYANAADALRRLRANTAPDADLDLALALDEARAGDLDSAAARLWTPLMDRAAVDSMPPERRHEYPWEREPLWLDGRFDGWHWYVARARAEVAAALGRWSDAHRAAAECVAARPLAGKEWLVLAVCAGRDGQPGEARLAARVAASLDPTLPEAPYLAGLYEWRAGHRSLAEEWFRAAVALDSTWRAPALASVRARIPAAAADSLPVEILTGVRAIGRLTSPLGPKLEEFVQMDMPSAILHRGAPRMLDSLMSNHKQVTLNLTVLVDERGRVVLNELPWFPPADLPATVVAAVVGSLNDWRFRPAMKNNAPHRVWAAVEYSFGTQPPPGSAGAGSH
ncbi:MAG: hypothetical protein HYR73_09980 [Candidatus Eisenbacteria bacterium]|nr:hypothetical protein [Candidatus Eisenbacteria bacterium]